MNTNINNTLFSLTIVSQCLACQPKNQEADNTSQKTKPLNVVFILSDDHRYDYMGFMNTIPWLETPNMDRMAKEGAHIKNAFVTTSLSSPSRASILTGMYSHSHKVVDNAAPLPDGLIFFPQYLQECGYKTAFFGKWHMGNDSGAPQPGFDHWEGFKGQGEYYNPLFYSSLSVYAQLKPVNCAVPPTAYNPVIVPVKPPETSLVRYFT